MNWQAVSFDWNQIRSFLAAYEEGSLSAGARALGLTQPTLSRQITELEEELGVIVFERGRRGLTLTQTGMELLDHVHSMGEAASLISLTASGHSQAIEGQVCISASDAMSTYHLPPILKRLKEIAPGIQIEVVASNELSDLQRREADIAIRHVRPEQPDLITKLVREPSANLYASTSYLDHYGRPESIEDLSNADFIGFENIDRSVSIYNSFGLSISKKNIKYNSSNVVVGWEIVKQGLGILVMSEEIAAMTPNIEKVLSDFKSIQFPVWLTTHRELHTNRRIRIVYDHLANELSDRKY